MHATANIADSPDLESSPILPIELERVIFEMAFDPDYPPSNARMTLVAKRVYTWLKPLIYRVFIRCTYQSYPDFRKSTIPPEAFLDDICRFSRHFFIDDTISLRPGALTTNLLARCHNLEDLFCWQPMHDIFPIISNFHNIRRLAGRISLFTDHHMYTAAFASTLTHLVLVYHPTWNTMLNIQVCALFPNLTHFAVHRDKNIDCRVLERDVRSSRQLRVFVFYTDLDRVWDDILVMYAAEDRMVMFSRALLCYSGWASGARGGQDTWSWAESIVFARQHGYFKSDEYQKEPIAAGFPLRDHLTEEGVKWFDTNIPTFQIESLNFLEDEM